jgi:hypothetical protein
VRYLEFLKDHLLDWMYRYRCYHLLQDVALCHALKATMAFLDQQDLIMDLLGNSPGLNPTENCWNHMKNKLKDVDISSLPKL